MIIITPNIVQALTQSLLTSLGLRTYAGLALVLIVITLAANVGRQAAAAEGVGVLGTALPVGRGL
jgi:hypothetical protein